MVPEPDFEAVAKALGHTFQDLTVLRDALTHRSFANEKPQQAPRDNERLEFLGDAVLSWTASALLYERFPGASEGELTRRRADLVCEGHLATVAAQLGIGAVLRLGRGEDRSGGREKPRLLCSAFEACVAAVLLDGGPAAAEACVRRMLEPWLTHQQPGEKDFKTRVQELAQARFGAAPAYVVAEASGPDHARRYRVRCEVDDSALGVGEGRSKAEAEQAAAGLALKALEAAEGATG